MISLKLARALVVTCFLVFTPAALVAANPQPEFDIRSGDGKVVISADQIRSYEWATHTLTLAPKVRDELAKRLRKDRIVSGIPFAVTVRGKVVYKGTFTSMVSSVSFSTPVIVVDTQAVEPKLGADQLRIQLGYPTAAFFKGEDPRADRRIREALKADGKLTEAAAAALAAPAHGSAQPPSRQIGLGEAQTIRSAILNENREVQVSLPETYGRTAISYPVLFLLDGSSHLLHASATTRFLASARNRVPEMIVVAIPNTNRNRDLTPGPGAATFQRFLGEELIPWVERNYRAAPERILVGHSLGASFAVHTLLTRVELFDAYVAASAPVWRYDGLAADMKSGLARAARAGAALYLTVGEHENEQLREGVAGLAAALKAADPAAVPAWSYVDMKDEDHSSTPQRSLYNALEARYAEWRLPSFDDQAELDRAGGLKGLEAHYERFSKRFGYTSPPPEDRLLQVGRIYTAAERHDEAIQLSDAYTVQYPAMAQRIVNQVGYDQLRRGQVERAVRTFKKNAKTFLASPNVHDSLGDAYCRAGDAASGRRSYQQAARVAATRSPPHPRLAWYQEKASKGCAAAP